MVGNQRFELPDQARVLAQHQLCVDSGLERDQPQLVQTCRLGLGERLVGDVVQSGSAPELERCAGCAGGGPRVAVLERLLGLGKPACEALRVEVAVAESQNVAAAACHEQIAVRVERFAQLRDVHVHALHGRRRRMFAPELVDQLLRGDHLVRVNQEIGQQRASLAGADVRGTVLRYYFQWAQQAEVHSGLPDRTPAGALNCRREAVSFAYARFSCGGPTYGNSESRSSCGPTPSSLAFPLVMTAMKGSATSSVRARPLSG